MQLQIEKLIYGGDGLSHLPPDEHGKGKTVFLPFVIPGEQVGASVIESRPGFARARLDKVLTPSPERVDPSCPYFARCGGCQYQHIAYDPQVCHKTDILRETLRRTAKLELEQEIQLHSGEPWNYRNRTRLRVRHAPEFALGYNLFNSHDVLAVESCPISSPLINQAIAAVWKLGRDGAVPESLHGLQFFADHADARLLIEAYVRSEKDSKAHPSKESSGGAPANSRSLDSRPPDPKRVGQVRRALARDGNSNPRLPRLATAADIQPFAAALRQALPQLAGVVVFATSPVDDEGRQRAPLTSIHPEPGLPIGDDSLLYHSVGHDYRVSAGSFFQTNRYLIDQLVQTVVGKQTGRGALDLYAGAGLFTAQLVRNFDTVLAVESSPHSFADLRHNVPPHIKTIRATTENFLAERSAQLALDVVVVDPPRAGLGEKVATALGRMAVPRLTYVSCDPSTLARDLQTLLKFSFRVEQAHLLDMFPQTFHMETVLHLVR